VRTVQWNNRARSDFYENIDFLLHNWSEKEAQAFIDQVSKIELILKQGNVEFQETELANVKRCLIRPQISLFYRVIDKENVELLRFWNNYQHQKKGIL